MGPRAGSSRSVVTADRRLAARDARLIDLVESGEVVTEVIQELRDEARTLPASIANSVVRTRVEEELSAIFTKAEDRLSVVMRNLQATGRSGLC